MEIKRNSLVVLRKEMKWKEYFILDRVSKVILFSVLPLDGIFFSLECELRNQELVGQGIKAEWYFLNLLLFIERQLAVFVWE